MEVANVPLVYTKDPFFRNQKDVLVPTTQLEPAEKDVERNEEGGTDDEKEEE